MEKERKQGKLTIFLGAAPGAGKTYALLEAGRTHLDEGIDVVIGIIEHHGMRDTQMLMESIPMVDPMKVVYQGKVWTEMDMDAIRERNPQLVLIDNLAHTNIPNAGHKHRYQDIEELLRKGIDVYTTLNIQNVESLNDIVAQITEVRVKETVPDKFIDLCYQIKLIDTSPEELIQRFNQGKIYIDKKEDGLKFFRTGNINALRELALRYTAQGVDKQLEDYMKQRRIKGPWPVGEKIMACVSSSPFSAQVIRIARRIAGGLKTEWIAVYVEDPNKELKNEKEKNQLDNNLRLAHELGAEVIHLTGSNVTEEIINLAENKNVTQIVIGKHLHSRIREFLQPSIVDEIVRKSQNISVHVIPSKIDYNNSNQRENILWGKKWYAYIWTLLLVALITIINKFLGLDQTNIALLYLLPVLFSASLWGSGPSIVASVLGVLSFDIFFVPPILSVTVNDLKYLLSFSMFMLVAIITGTFATRLRNQVVISRKREMRTAALYELSKKIAVETDIEGILNTVVNVISETIDGDAVVFMPNASGKIIVKATTVLPNHKLLDKREIEVINWVYNNSRMAGNGTDTLPEAYGLYLSLRSEGKSVGVLGVRLKKPEQTLSLEQRRLLEAFTNLAAFAIIRLQLATEAQQSRNLVQSEKLRTALFNSISHELRTPLSSILGAVTSLLEEYDIYSEEDKKFLLQTINYGALRMNCLIVNLLDMARLESGMMQLKREWCDIQEIIGVALGTLKVLLKDRNLKVEIPSEVPLVYIDFTLIEQVISNLLDNAIKYSSNEDEIIINVFLEEDELKVAISDNGCGVPIMDREKIFEKFYRLYSPKNVAGTGLGLSICKGIVEAHGGRIRVDSKPEGGSIFTFSLPLDNIKYKKVGEINE